MGARWVPNDINIRVRSGCGSDQQDEKAKKKKKRSKGPHHSLETIFLDVSPL